MPLWLWPEKSTNFHHKHLRVFKCCGVNGTHEPALDHTAIIIIFIYLKVARKAVGSVREEKRNWLWTHALWKKLQHWKKHALQWSLQGHRKRVIEEHLKSDVLQARMLQEACSIIRVLMWTSCRREAATICLRPCDLDLRHFDLESGVRVMCDVGYLCANFSLPKPLCSRLRPDLRDRQTDRWQTETDVRQKHRLMPPPRGGV